MNRPEDNRQDISREGEIVSYWRMVWRDYASIAVVAASSLWVYRLPMYLLDHRVVPVSKYNPRSNLEDQSPAYEGPLELSYPYIREPIPTWACGVVVVLIPLIVIALFQLKLRSLWDFHAGLTGTLKATVSSTLIATTFKHFIGGFRPHYVQVCKPDMTMIFGGTSQLQSFFNSSACTANSHDVNRAIQGFPSGHTTSAFAGAMFLTLYLNAKLKAFADHASEFWVFIVTITPLLLASLIGGSMYISYQHHAYEVVIGMVTGIAVGALGYRSSYAAVFDFRYNHIPLPPFGARARFEYGIDTSSVRSISTGGGDNSEETHPVMWSWWTRSGAGVLEQERALSWQKIMGCAGKSTLGRMTSKLRTVKVNGDKHATEANDQSKIDQ
ncbi:phosphatidic acid phosphatase type 2/haloperoxidase [Cadophora sp. MPI-SDFR-AT-0126]|nr:phosphatidic acid phosphatase type 2/haloperoxidase [Leotiomycetes sp. MPI-SDFR-AT-0126]